MRLVTSPAEIQERALEYRARGLTVGLVPTMGWFHEGHLSLMRLARKKADRVIVSLFVNPIQFGPNEDLDSYPYDLERDRRLAEETGVDILFAPEKQVMYPSGFSSSVIVSGLSSRLCGSSRPGHFDGVTTVVAKLFHLTVPHLAVFGEKDFQQLAVIRKMVDDLDFPVEILGHPIVREESGLAMSSRNTYLKSSEMPAALSLSEGIREAVKRVNRPGAESIDARQVKELVSAIINAHRECEIDYVEVVDSISLENCTEITENSLLVLAVKINNRIRLIDNSILKGS